MKEIIKNIHKKSAGYFLIRVIKTAAFLLYLAVGLLYFPTKTAETEFAAYAPPGIKRETKETDTTVSAPEKSYFETEATLTAYCPCEKCSEGYGRNTATGKTAKANRTAAVDPKVIPYGTKIEIDGKTYVAEDCGGAVKGYAIDIFFDTHEETERFGRQKKIVKIYED